MLSDQRGYIMKADENLYQNTVRLNLSEKSYLKHNRRAYRVAMMFVKRNLFSIGKMGSNFFRWLSADVLDIITTLVVEETCVDPPLERAYQRELLFVSEISGALFSERVAVDQRRPSSEVIINPREMMLPVEPEQLLRATTIPHLLTLKLHETSAANPTAYMVTK